VAGIVKLDDAGLYLSLRAGDGFFAAIRRGLGRGILRMAPYLMKTLSIAGTAAMFLVGGGILTHGIPAAHDWIEHAAHLAGGMAVVGGVIQAITPLVLNALSGVVAGAICVAVVSAAKKAWPGAAKT